MQLTAVSWTRYGHDRTYLKAAGGESVAWIDNRTGAITVENEEFRLAVEEWILASTSPIAPAPGPTQLPPVAAASTPPQPPADVDLADNLPGQATRARALEERYAMRKKSRFLTVAARVLDSQTDERQWRVGAAGEETVGDRLDKLTRHGWQVLHAVPIGTKGSDIDHLLIGPGGVWTLNTKNHPGKKVWVAGSQVRVDGFVQPYIRNSEFEANRVRKILTQRLGWEPFVKSALVFLTGTLVPDVTIKAEPNNVEILDRMDIPGVFKRSTGRLTEQQIAAIFNVARWQSTWVG